MERNVLDVRVLVNKQRLEAISDDSREGATEKSGKNGAQIVVKKGVRVDAKLPTLPEFIDLNARGNNKWNLEL